MNKKLSLGHNILVKNCKTNYIKKKQQNDFINNFYQIIKLHVSFAKKQYKYKKCQKKYIYIFLYKPLNRLSAIFIISFLQNK